MRMLYRPALLVLAIGMVASCSNSGSTTPSTTPTPTPNANFAAVHVPSSGGYGPSSFVPSAVTVPVGGSVDWSNGDSIEHHPFANDGSWNADLPAGSDATVTFNTAGTYAYHCSIHPTMTGTITVK
jgi:plastocyanin